MNATKVKPKLDDEAKALVKTIKRYKAEWMKIFPTRRPEWVDMEVVLEVPTGELTEDGLKTLAIVGRSNRDCHAETTGLTGKEGFVAQGLEGKVRIRKSLFGALMNLRDLIKPGRGRIVTVAKGGGQ